MQRDTEASLHDSLRHLEPLIEFMASNQFPVESDCSKLDEVYGSVTSTNQCLASECQSCKWFPSVRDVARRASAVRVKAIDASKKGKSRDGECCMFCGQHEKNNYYVIDAYGSTDAAMSFHRCRKAVAVSAIIEEEQDNVWTEHGTDGVLAEHDLGRFVAGQYCTRLFLMLNLLHFAFLHEAAFADYYLYLKKERASKERLSPYACENKAERMCGLFSKIKEAIANPKAETPVPREHVELWVEIERLRQQAARCDDDKLALLLKSRSEDVLHDASYFEEVDDKNRMRLKSKKCAPASPSEPVPRNRIDPLEEEAAEDDGDRGLERRRTAKKKRRVIESDDEEEEDQPQKPKSSTRHPRSVRPSTRAKRAVPEDAVLGEVRESNDAGPSNGYFSTHHGGPTLRTSSGGASQVYDCASESDLDDSDSDCSSSGSDRCFIVDDDAELEVEEEAPPAAARKKKKSRIAGRSTQTNKQNQAVDPQANVAAASEQPREILLFLTKLTGALLSPPDPLLSDPALARRTCELLLQAHLEERPSALLLRLGELHNAVTAKGSGWQEKALSHALHAISEANNSGYASTETHA